MRSLRTIQSAVAVGKGKAPTFAVRDLKFSYFFVIDVVFGFCFASFEHQNKRKMLATKGVLELHNAAQERIAVLEAELTGAHDATSRERQVSCAKSLSKINLLQH